MILLYYQNYFEVKMSSLETNENNKINRMIFLFPFLKLQPLFDFEPEVPKTPYSVGVAGRCDSERGSTATPFLSPA